MIKDFYRFFITLILTFYLFNCINRFVTMMADVAQLVRALVCGTRCREFESLHPPHIKKAHRKMGFFLLDGGCRFELSEREFDTSERRTGVRRSPFGDERK